MLCNLGDGRAYCPEDAGMTTPEGSRSPGDMSPGPYFSPIASTTSLLDNINGMNAGRYDNNMV